MKTLATCLLAAFLTSPILALGSESRITEVTVFQDRASVKRRQSAAVSKGAHSIAFTGVTPLLDLDSLKARLTDRKNVTILGIRSLPIFLEKSAKKEVEDLRKRQQALQAERSRINDEVAQLIGQNQNLRLLADHYKDSFSVNLHQRIWEQKGFRSFVAFLANQGGKLNSSWNKLYLRNEKLEQDLEFVSSKLSELTTASDKKTITTWVDLVADADSAGEVEIQYLVPNAGWSPVYDILISTPKNTARLEQGALVWQTSGEDWSGVKLSLSNARTDLRTNPPSIGSYTLSFREVKKVQTSVGGKTEDVKAIVVNDKQPDDDGEEGGRRPASTGIAKIFRVGGLRSVRDGSSKVKVPVATKELAYNEHLELVASQYAHVFRKAELSNPFSWDLAPGPISVFYNGAFQQQTWLEEVGRGGPFAVNCGVDHDLVVYRGTSESTEEPGLIDRRRHFKRNVEVRIENFSSRARQVKVLEPHPVSEIKDLKVDLAGRGGRQTQQGTEGWVFWNVNVAPRKWEIVELKLDVAVPKETQFSW